MVEHIYSTDVGFVVKIDFFYSNVVSNMFCFDVTRHLCALHYIQPSGVNVGMKGAQTPTLEQNLPPLMEQCVKDGINNLLIRMTSKFRNHVNLVV